MSLPLETWDQADGRWDAGFWDGATPNQNNTMPVQNISAEFTEQGLTDLKADIVALNPQFPMLVTLTDSERMSLQRVAAGREVFCETAFTGAGTFPTVVPGFMSAVDWGKDENYFVQLGQLEVLIEALLAKVQDTKAAVGAERYRQARKFYEAVKSAKEDVPGLQALYETLKAQFEGQGPGGGNGEEEEEGGSEGSGGSGENPTP